jgi:hypothetical protein
MSDHKCARCKAEFDGPGMRRWKKIYCPSCTGIMHDQEREHMALRYIAMSDRAQLKMLEDYVSGKVVIEQCPQITSQVEELMACVGGSRGFAQRYWAEFLMAVPGSPTRQRYLTLLLQSVEAISARGDAKSDLSQATPEELEVIMQTVFEKVLQRRGLERSARIETLNTEQESILVDADE